MTWQPIETAPKDGARILAWSASDGLNITAFDDWGGSRLKAEPGGFCIKDGAWAKRWAPTHWMPLPDPPNTEG